MLIFCVNMVFQLFSIPELSGYQLNRRLRILICDHCHYCVPAKGLDRHSRNPNHPTRISTYIPDLSRYIDAGLLQVGLPSPRLPFCRFYRGLNVKTGLVCTLCSKFVAPTQKQLRMHYKASHPKSSRTILGKPCHYQSLCASGPSSSLFPVTYHPPKPQSISTDYVTSTRLAIDEVVRRTLPDPDIRQVSYWHATTQWYKYVIGQDPKPLVDLADIPTSPEYAHITRFVDKVKQYLDYAYSVIPIASELSRQIIATPKG